MNALRSVHDNAQCINVLWAKPKDAQLELRRRKNESQDRGQDNRRDGGVLGGGVEGAAERVVVAAATLGVASPTTAVEEDAETEAAATGQGLGQEVEHPDAARAMVLGYPTGEMVAAVRAAVKVDAGMARKAVPKAAHQAPPARP